MILTLTKLNKSYGKNHALCDFSAVLTPGIYALLGPNGSGKSTLMNIITDNISSDSGEITYAENEASEAENVRAMGVRFREKLGFMPQYPGLYPSFTVERFMWYMAALKDIPKEDAVGQIASILASVELDDVASRRIGALSGGMKQRLTLAQAVLGDPEILILDEPTAGLDPKQRISIRNYISKIALDKIVLIATHVVSDVEYIARDVIMLKKGVIVDHSPPHELVRKIEGKVWNVRCLPDEISRYQSSLRVINIVRDDEASDGSVLLRVLAQTKPTENSAAVAPTLEDYYLYVFAPEG